MGVREEAGLSRVPREPRSANWTRVVPRGQAWALTPLAGQSLGPRAASPRSPQWSQTSLVQMAFVHEGSSGRGGRRCELFAATRPAVGERVARLR